MDFDTGAKTITIESSDLADTRGPTSFTLTGEVALPDSTTAQDTIVFSIEMIDPCHTTEIRSASTDSL